ncbi:MAG: hypothetical protein ACI9CD_000084 [Candidatus Deianiraeaceae bacterium]
MSEAKEVCNFISHINFYLPVATLIVGAIIGRVAPSWRDKKSDNKDSYAIYKEDKKQLENCEAIYHTTLNDIYDKLLQKHLISKDEYDNFLRKGNQYLAQAKVICVGCKNSHIFDKEQIQDFKQEIKELVNLENIQKFYTIANLLRKKLSIKRTVMSKSNYQVILDFVEN